MAEIRRGETDRVPLPEVAGRSVWFVVIDLKGGEPVVEGHQHTSSLAKRLAHAQPGTRCYAIWKGQHSADLFEMDIPRLLERIKKKIGPTIYR